MNLYRPQKLQKGLKKKAGKVSLCSSFSPSVLKRGKGKGEEEKKRKEERKRVVMNEAFIQSE